MKLPVIPYEITIRDKRQPQLDITQRICPQIEFYLLQNIDTKPEISLLAAQRYTVHRNIIDVVKWWKEYDIDINYSLKGPVPVSNEIINNRTAQTLALIYSGTNLKLPEPQIMKIFILVGVSSFADGYLGEAFEPVGAVGVGGPLQGAAAGSMPDARRVLAHEIGHVWGLSHNNNVTNLMHHITNTRSLQDAYLTDTQVEKIKKNCRER